MTAFHPIAEIQTGALPAPPPLSAPAAKHAFRMLQRMLIVMPLPWAPRDRRLRHRRPTPNVPCQGWTYPARRHAADVLSSASLYLSNFSCNA